MDWGAALIKGLELVTAVGYSLTSIKLIRNGLFRRYRALLGYLLYSSFHTSAILLFFGNSSSPAYMKFWVFTQPINWLFHGLVVVELYSLVLEKHRGLYTLGRWFLYGGMSLSVLISALTLLPRLNGGEVQSSRLLPYYFAIRRGVDFSLLLFLLLLLAWLTRYPVPLSRNVIVHSLAYSVLFLSNTAGVLAREIFGLNVSGSVNTFLLGVEAACVLIWLVFLTAKGEEVRISVPSFGPEHEQRILDQLETLNQTLLKMSRD
jgi:hypothetical protein